MKLTTAFVPITKTDKHNDGTLTVFGKVTGPDLDRDLQICDPTWLAKAMPEWFITGANIREQHSHIAAGVGQELTQDGDDWYLKSLIVDPGSVLKVETGVLKGYSIGIAQARVIKDAKAPNGRICGGSVAESSLVDRPSNPTAMLMLGKSVGGSWVQVEEFLEKDANEVGGETEDPSEDAAEEDGEVDLVGQVRAFLVQLLAGEVDELVDGTGGKGPIRALLCLLDDLDWFAESDAYDDAQAIKAAIAKTITPDHVEATDVDTIATITKLVKSAVADDATDDDKTELVELRKALGIDDLAAKITDSEAATTKASEAETRIKALEADLAEVKQLARPGGPMLAAPTTAQPDGKAASYLADAARVAASNPHLAEGYRQLAKTAGEIPTAS